MISNIGSAPFSLELSFNVRSWPFLRLLLCEYCFLFQLIIRLFFNLITFVIETKHVESFGFFADFFNFWKRCIFDILLNEFLKEIIVIFYNRTVLIYLIKNLFLFGCKSSDTFRASSLLEIVVIKVDNFVDFRVWACVSDDLDQTVNDSLVVKLRYCSGKRQVPNIRLWLTFFILKGFFFRGFFKGDHLFNLR